MKRVLVIATLLMVSCGGKQQQSESIESTESTQTTVITAAPKQKVSLRPQSEEKELPELKMILPKKAPIDVKVVTADKDAEYINSKKTTPTRE